MAGSHATRGEGKSGHYGPLYGAYVVKLGLGRSSACFEFGQNPQAAIDAPRWHVYPDFTIGLESGFEQSIAAKLEDLGHSVRFEKNESVFGGAQLILRTDNGFVAGSDSRKEGLAAGY